MQTKPKVIRKPTPIRNAALAVSVTCNLFLFGLGYAVVTGQLAHVDTVESKQVALYSGDYVATLQGAAR